MAAVLKFSIVAPNALVAAVVVLAAILIPSFVVLNKRIKEQAAMQEQKERAKAATAKISVTGDIKYAKIEQEVGSTEFVGYSENEATAKILASGILKYIPDLIDMKVIDDIILIDDIYTSGCNIDEDCIQALYDNGANRVVFYAIAYIELLEISYSLIERIAIMCRIR